MRKEEGTKEDIIRYRLAQADVCVTSAKSLLEFNDLAGALNRIYYGMFYAVAAIALMHGYKTSKHHQLLGWFNREIVNTGKVDRLLGNIVRNAFETRMDSDYEAMVFFECHEVEAMLPLMENFISSVKRLLNSNASPPYDASTDNA